MSTSTPTYCPTTLSEELAAKTQEGFDKIIADMVAPADSPAAQGSRKPKKRYITVLVNMPHVKKFDKEPTMSLTYGCSFVVEVGDQVLCPPTRLNSKWTRGIVTDLEGSGYRGPVKYVAPFGGRRDKKNGASK